LLMVISIIAVLSSLAVGLLLSARDDASAARTRSIIARCQAVLNARLEDYEARNMPFRFEDVFGPNPTVPEKKECRNYTTIEWLMVEMPSKMNEFDGTYAFPRKNSVSFYGDPEYQQAMTNRRTSMHQANLDYLTRYGAANFANFQQSKLLYMILYNSWDGDNRGTHFLQPSEVKLDSGVPYIVDSFGEPMTFRIFSDTSPGDDSLWNAHNTGTISLENVVIEIKSNKIVE
jgi:type II secretory pathway pseudopilin PulG